MEPFGQSVFQSLRDHVEAVEPAAQFVEPRILRRVIRLDRRLPGFGLTVPHRKTYAIERDRLLAFVDRAELELPPAADLPKIVILLSKPEDDESLISATPEQVMYRYGRLLFHACVHVELDRRAASQELPGQWAAQRREQLGDIEFAEIRSVLQKDEFLFQATDDVETYIEFVAVYLELLYFAPDELPVYFPAIRNWAEVERIVACDIDHDALFNRLKFAPWIPKDLDPADEVVHDPDIVAPSFREPAVTLHEFRRMQAAAERAAATGNSVKAAIAHTRAARRAPPGYAAEAQAAARDELKRFSHRLQKVLELSDQEAAAWHHAMLPLLTPAADGFWSSEARLLYDLQKVCVEQERGVYKLSLIEWVRTFGRRPIKRPLPLLRDALMLRHLRTAHRRATQARITAAERARLLEQLAAVLPQIERRSRDRLRPLLVQVFDEVGLVPQNIPEEVSRRKLIEELLDRVVEHSYLSMGDLRDALSKNDLKLPDVSRVIDLILGDRLLKADKKLDTALDGVYRRGAIYLRWPQTISSIAFGTSFGRFLTKYLALPFGGAYLAIEFVRHIAALLKGEHQTAQEVIEHTVKTAKSIHWTPDWSLYGGVLALGTWISLLIHRPAFRAWNVALLGQLWQVARRVTYELPAQILRSKFVQQILNSQVYAAIHNYVLRPGVAAGLIWLVASVSGQPTSSRTVFEIFLVAALFLNSSIGRYVTEVGSDFLVRLWHELRMRVFAAAFQLVMEVFHGLLVAVERLVYSVDEWLRFRAGDSRWVQLVKLVGGVVWFFLAYVIVFAFMLLIEPQVNPIKHFPVVTVSHKLILPLGPMFVKQLSPLLGAAEAYTLVWTTIWLIPGIFGFLVWELKENWRLYAANRAPALKPVPIGHHGETMQRLLRPGFHSGTLPKAFAALRRATRKADLSGDRTAVQRKYQAVEHLEESVARFVERDLTYLLHDAQVLPFEVKLGKLHVGTNRIDIELTRAGDASHPALLSFEDDAGVLSGLLARPGWLDDLSPHERSAFTIALAGLFERAGIDRIGGATATEPLPEIAWDDWIAIWSKPASSEASGVHSPDANSLLAPRPIEPTA
jgi:hypothetical protein